MTDAETPEEIRADLEKQARLFTESLRDGTLTADIPQTPANRALRDMGIEIVEKQEKTTGGIDLRAGLDEKLAETAKE